VKTRSFYILATDIFSHVSVVAEKRVDVLINNAGLLRTSRAVTEDGFEMHLGVNYLGNWLNFSLVYLVI